MTVVLSVGLLNHTAIWWWQFHNYQSSRFSGLTIPASMPLYDFSASESNGFRHNWFDYTLVLAYYGMLTHYGPVMPYGIIELGQHWPHQAITWTNVNLSSEVFSGIYPETNFPWRTHELPYLCGANEFSKTATRQAGVPHGKVDCIDIQLQSHLQMVACFSEWKTEITSKRQWTKYFLKFLTHQTIILGLHSLWLWL